MSWLGWASDAIASEESVPGTVDAIFAEVPKALPASPEERALSTNCFVLHGDLFGDGRHLAVMAGGGTIVAEPGKEGWKEIARWPVAAAWVAKGENREEKGYFHISPPESPFVLKDLDGDRVPELLIAFNDDGYLLGYQIVKKRCHAHDLELLAITSVGEPSYRSGYLLTHTSAGGRKAWGGGDRYYRWVDGTPVFVAESYENCADPEHSLNFYARVQPDKSEERFCVRDDEERRINRCKPGAIDGSSEEKPFVNVRFIARTPGVEWSHEAEEAFLFQKLTGLDWKLRTPQAEDVSSDQVGQEFAKFKPEVHGEPEAVRAFNAMPSPAP